MKEVKQCSTCGRLFMDYQLERVFTGRMQLVCYKCIKEGRKLTGEGLHNHYTKHVNKGGGRK